MTDENPRTCDNLLDEVTALLTSAEDTLTAACALVDIITTEEPTTETHAAACELAVTAFLGRRALDGALEALSRRHVQMPAMLTGIRVVIEFGLASRELVDVLLDAAQRDVA